MRHLLSFCPLARLFGPWRASAAHFEVLRLLPLILAILLGLAVATPVAAESADGVAVTTDSAAYALGDPIQVTIANDGLDRITSGGLACDDLWPLAPEQLDPDGNWQPVAVPRHQCIGIAGILVAPGQTQVRTITPALDPGTYRLVYAFRVVGAGTELTATSDPFDVIDPNAPTK